MTIAQQDGKGSTAQDRTASLFQYQIQIHYGKLVFEGPRYYDTLPVDIVDDPHGKTMKMRWSEKKQRWQESPCGSYPRVAVFGCGYDYMPYLD